MLGLQLYGPLSKQAMGELELLEAMKNIGYKRVEPCICMDGESDNPSFWTVKHFCELQPELAKMGLDVISCHVAMSDEEQALSNMYMLAKEYGIRYFIFNASFELTKEGVERAADRFLRMSDMLEMVGGTILIHNGKYDVAVEVEGRSADEYLMDLCEDRIGMQIDIGWALAGGVDPYDFYKRNQQRILSIHFKDFEKPGVSDVDCIIGKGVVDTELFVKIGIENNLPLFVDQDAYTDVIGDAKRSYEFVTSKGDI